jgi:soluble lytic murein transglycosylase-like protein
MSSCANLILWQLRSIVLASAVQALMEGRSAQATATKAWSCPEQFMSLLLRACERHGVDPALAAAVAKAESGFNAHAVSPAGAKGVMQLMDSTARALGVRDPFDPTENIEAGVRLLASLLRQFQDERLALAAYNAGPRAVLDSGGVPSIPETQEFVRRVLAYRSEYSRISYQA